MVSVVASATMPRARRTPLPPRSRHARPEVPPSEWIVNDMFELAIVEREPWERVHAPWSVAAAQTRTSARPSAGQTQAA